MAAIQDVLRQSLAGRYRIERELGRGGMATVFLAEDLKHRRPVAIKVLDPELAAAIGPERFLREIETSARLTHPHILPLFDSGQADGLLFYVMPHVAGESLRARLERETQLPVEEAIQIAREVAGALDYAHRQGVTHRDIKPENILIEEGHALVADFGIARVRAPGGRDTQAATVGAGTLTTEGGMVGTPAYMSPEQASGSRTVDGLSDQYSLACVVYEMLAGQPPFTGPTVESLVHQHLSATTIEISALAVGPDGSLFFAESGDQSPGSPGGPYTKVRRVGTDGIITAYVGRWCESSADATGKATTVCINAVKDIGVDAAGSLYVLEGPRLRRVTPEGWISTSMSLNTTGFSPNAMAFAPDGSIYLANGGNAQSEFDLKPHGVYRLDPDGTLNIVAGGMQTMTCGGGYVGDGPTTSTTHNSLCGSLSQYLVTCGDKGAASMTGPTRAIRETAAYAIAREWLRIMFSLDFALA